MKVNQINQKKKTNKKKNRKGFTLIELLAVIIILGVLLLIAVPSVSKYIENSRKNTYINSLKTLTNAVSTAINSMELPLLPGKDEGVIVPFSKIDLEKSSAETKSPYAEYVAEKSYILVTYDDNQYSYYVVALDSAGNGVPLVNERNLSTQAITTKVDELNNNIFSMTQIANSTSTNPIDTDSLTMYRIDEVDDYIKVKICFSAYAKGKVIQLKDGSRWYSTLASSSDDEMITLVSYNHMQTISSQSGLQSDSKTSPVLRYNTTQLATSYETSEIYAKAQEIVSNAQIKLTAAGLNMNGSVVKMPSVEDFGCDPIRGCPAPYTLPYLNGNGAFWTRDIASSGWILTITSSGVGQATADNQYGIRIVLKTLKSNIDKQVTKTLG